MNFCDVSTSSASQPATIASPCGFFDFSELDEQERRMSQKNAMLVRRVLESIYLLVHDRGNHAAAQADHGHFSHQLVDTGVEVLLALEIIGYKKFPRKTDAQAISWQHWRHQTAAKACPSYPRQPSGTTQRTSRCEHICVDSGNILLSSLLL